MTDAPEPAATVDAASAAALLIDACSTTWLLDRPHPLPQFFVQGLAVLKPIEEQVDVNRVVAECDFGAGSERFSALAILSRPEGGVHRLIDVAIRPIGGSHWPTLCCDFRLDFDPAATVTTTVSTSPQAARESSNASRWSSSPSARWAAEQARQRHG